MFVLPLFSEGEQRQGWLMRLSEPFQSILRKLAEGPPPPTNDPEKQSERSLEITRERAREREMAEREMRSSERRIGRERRDLLGEKRADLQEEIQTRLAIEDGRIEELRRRRKHLELERQRIDEEIKAAEAGEYSKSPRGAGPRWDALALKRLQMERRQIEDLVAQEDLRLRAAEEMRTELLNRRIAEVEAAAKRRAQEARHEQLEEEARKEAYLARMKDAHVAFNHPKEMYVSRRTQVTLALAPSQQKAQEFSRECFRTCRRRRNKDGISTIRSAYARQAARQRFQDRGSGTGRETGVGRQDGGVDLVCRATGRRNGKAAPP